MNSYRVAIRKSILSVMMIVIIGMLSSCGNKPDSTGEKEVMAEATTTTRTITDMAGREVEIPLTIEKVFSVNNNGTILLYTLSPEKMVGWNSKISNGSKDYMDEEIAQLPMLGILYGNSSQSNPEEILISDPDIILFMDAKADEKIIEAADKIEKELLIPVVVLKGSLENYDLTYAFAGDLLGEEERATELINYYKMSLDKVNKAVAMIPQEEKVSVYYAREKDGLSTETAKSSNAKLIELCGGINVATSEDVSIKSPIVSIEQVIAWNPDVIFTGNAGFVEEGTYQEITTNANWGNIDALLEGRVYPTPQVPFNWFDRPPSVNTIVGMNYVLYMLYPEYYEGDIVEDVMSYYHLFYHYDLSEEEAKAFLNMN